MSQNYSVKISKLDHSQTINFRVPDKTKLSLPVVALKATTTANFVATLQSQFLDFPAYYCLHGLQTCIIGHVN